MNKPTVLILGSSGMLGHAVTKYFTADKHNFYARGLHRKDLEEGNIDMEKDEDINALVCGYEYVINCIGVIKPFMDKKSADPVYINSLLPHKLAKCSQRLIHITTDCVYSGKKGQYTEDDEHDYEDEYGKTKSAGEPKDRCMVLRTSIIGEEIKNFVSLVEWAKSQRGKNINGFINHLWNGMTTTTYAKVCAQIIDDKLYRNGLFHIYSNTVTKFELLELISDRFNLGLKINPCETSTPCDRSLSSNRSLVSQLDIPSIEDQIRGMPGNTPSVYT